MFSLTHAPLPKWKNIFKIFLKKEKSDLELATPWLQDKEKGFWFSRSSWSLYTIVKFRMLVTGDKNINLWLPAFFCNSSIAPIRNLNVKFSFYPLLTDGSPDMSSFNTMLDKGYPALIVGVHFFGNPTDLFEMVNFSKKYKAWFIEDCAHCLKSDIGIGNSGDFVLYSPHKFLPIPDGGLLIIRNEGPGKISEKLLDRFNFSELYHLVINEGRIIRRTSFIWLLKRVLQKIGVRSKKKLMKFQEDESVMDSGMLIHPKMSLLAKKLLTFIHTKIEEEIFFRKKNQEAWIKNLIKKKIINKDIFLPKENYTPYLARFVAKDAKSAEDIFNLLQKYGIPVSTWPDLPPEVLADEIRHKVSIELRAKSFLLPVHQSVNLSKIKSF